MPRFHSGLRSGRLLRVGRERLNASWQSPSTRNKLHRLAALTRGQNKSAFILTTHHSIADGISSAYAIRDLIQLLAGKTLEPSRPIPALEPLVNADGLGVLMGFEHEQAIGVTTTDNSLGLLHTMFTPIPSLLPRAAEILQRACE
jgi:hypothetical protein